MFTTQGFTYPACMGIWRMWAPPGERSRLLTVAFSGPYLGAFLGLLTSGLLSQWLGWQAPFYVYGSAGILWFCAWLPCSAERPSSHWFIGQCEREYIDEAIGENVDAALGPHLQKRTTPWAKILTSLPVHATVLVHFAQSWSFHLLITEPTKYFADVFHYDMSKGGFFSALPHLIMALVVLIGGQVADALRSSVFTTTPVRKIYICIGFGMEALFLLAVGYSNDSTVAIVCLTIAVTFSGLGMSGFSVNHMDIAPRFASILMGLSNGLSTVAGILVTLVTAEITRDHTHQSWSNIFLIASLMHVVGATFYAIFGSGERQPWSEETGKTDDEED